MGREPRDRHPSVEMAIPVPNDPLVDMDPDFPRMRIERAREHFYELQRERLAFHSLDPYGVRKVSCPERGYHVYRLELRHLPAPRMSMIVGGLVHNLRSALDNLMWEMCGRPRDPESRLAFPIFVDKPAKGFSRRPGWSQLGEAAFRAIEKVQPYNGPDSRDDVQDALRYVNFLWNSNKHRALQIGIVVPMGGSYYIDDAGGDLDRYELIESGGSLNDGAEIARLTFPPNDPPDAHLNFTFDVAFRERAREGSEWLISWRNLRWFYNAVCNIVFERLGPERQAPFTSQVVPDDLALE